MLAAVKRFLRSIPPGVRVVLMLLAVVWALEPVSSLSGTFTLSSWLGLDGSAVRGGQFWRLGTYALMVDNLFNLLGTGLLLLMCGAPVERAWSRNEFWSFGLLAAVGTGAVGWWAQAWGATVVGFGGVLYALLMAWAGLKGNQRLELPGIGTLPVQAVAGLVGLVMFLSSAALAGVATALVSASGAGIGWLYLSVRWHWIASRQARIVACGRGGRLEL